MKTIYEVVNGPREERGTNLSTIDRGLIANVALAREAALLRDSEAEADYHDAINDLLARREENGGKRP